MSEAKYNVPEGGLAAVDEAISIVRRRQKEIYYDDELIAGDVRDITLEAFIRWQAENPPFPTVEQLGQMSFMGCVALNGNWDGKNLCAEWIRRMYLAPDLEVPEEIKDLVLPFDMKTADGYRRNVAIIEAYRRGKGSR